MGKIEKIIKKGSVEGQTAEVYPVTSTKAVYDENNKRLDNIITGLQESVYLKTPIPISTDNTTESKAQNVKNISDYIEKAKAAGIADVNGMGVTCLIDDYFSGVGYIMGNTDVSIHGIKTTDDLVDNRVFSIQNGEYYESKIQSENSNELSTTSKKLVPAINEVNTLAKSKGNGTITEVRMNGVSKGTSGVVDLGTVITAHQDISGKQDKLISGTNIKTINGESVLGSGDITITSSGGAYPEVNHGTGDTTFILTPNTFHVWDEVTSLTLNFGNETSGVANEYLFQFTSGSTATSLTLPDDIKWANDNVPTIGANMIYQMSILHGLASVLEFNYIDYNKEPLTFKISSPGTINWTASDSSASKTIEYKLNNGEWTSIISNTGSSAPTINVIEGDKVQFRGSNTQYATSESNYNSFSGSTASFEAKGNIMSLIYGDDFKNKLTISSTYAFYGLFKNCTGLTSAENLILPATSLTNYCYGNMFQGCTSLTMAPKLPATDLAESCYIEMFWNCKSLTTAPKLPATTLTSTCYQNMFRSCSSLTVAPELPATTLADSCYLQMFYDCTSLTTAPSALPATTLASNCYSSMFNGCTSLTTAPALPATTLALFCYNSMFAVCTSLTTAPELPATTLGRSCYDSMFYKCTKLNYIKCLATDISATNCTSNWVSGVASTGTFVKAADMTSWKTDTSGIPRGWTVQDA